ncbi:MAG: hypothetical protein JO117_01605 [Verrucomicrobia bacterium]|nr:hypothetical protein [Verrucomicrobiota bacterium]MBV9657789.1 hypothetical protein [Verrucomicrobiota bacterium]
MNSLLQSKRWVVVIVASGVALYHFGCGGDTLLAQQPYPGEASAALREIAIQQQSTPASQPHEADTLWGGLILATNEASPAQLPQELQAQERQLSAFGYNQFRLLGHNTKTVPTGTEDWLVPGQRYSLKVDTKHPLPAGGYALGLQLFQEQRLLVEAEVNLHRRRPLFIRGPQVGRGQLIIMLMVL